MAARSSEGIGSLSTYHAAIIRCKYAITLCCFECYLVSFDQLPLAGLILELDGTTVAANAALCRLVGRSPQELVGRPLDVLVPGSVAPLLALGQRSRAIELELAGDRGGVVLDVIVGFPPTNVVVR